MPALVGTLEKETGVALSWLMQSEMIGNPEKFLAVLHRKNQTSTSGGKINIDGEMISSEETVQLLGISLDYKLDFDPHISNTCRKAETQLNYLFKFQILSSGLVFFIFQISS